MIPTIQSHFGLLQIMIPAIESHFVCLAADHDLGRQLRVSGSLNTGAGPRPVSPDGRPDSEDGRCQSLGSRSALGSLLVGAAHLTEQLAAGKEPDPAVAEERDEVVTGESRHPITGRHQGRAPAAGANHQDDVRSARRFRQVRRVSQEEFAVPPWPRCHGHQPRPLRGEGETVCRRRVRPERRAVCDRCRHGFWGQQARAHEFSPCFDEREERLARCWGTAGGRCGQVPHERDERLEPGGGPEGGQPGERGPSRADARPDDEGHDGEAQRRLRPSGGDQRARTGGSAPPWLDGGCQHQRRCRFQPYGRPASPPPAGHGPSDSPSHPHLQRGDLPCHQQRGAGVAAVDGNAVRRSQPAHPPLAGRPVGLPSRRLCRRASHGVRGTAPRHGRRLAGAAAVVQQLREAGQSEPSPTQSEVSAAHLRAANAQLPDGGRGGRWRCRGDGRIAAAVESRDPGKGAGPPATLRSGRRLGRTQGPVSQAQEDGEQRWRGLRGQVVPLGVCFLAGWPRPGESRPQQGCRHQREAAQGWKLSVSARSVEADVKETTASQREQDAAGSSPGCRWRGQAFRGPGMAGGESRRDGRQRGEEAWRGWRAGGCRQWK